MNEVTLALEDGTEWELVSLIHHLAEEKFDNDIMHPELDELWKLLPED